MTKAVRQMKEDMKLIDVFIEICDARIPVSSRNPQIGEMAHSKQLVVLLNKADLADPAQTARWIDFLKDQGNFAAAIDSRNKKSIRAVDEVVEAASAKKRERDKKRGIRNRPVRAMVCGIPNSGKSTFINTYAGKSSARTGNKPGVTRGKQWIRMNKNVELLDTPGILWPKFEDEATGLNLAFVGSIKDEVYDTESLALKLLKRLSESYPGIVEKQYSIDEGSPEAMINGIALKRGCIKSGGEADYSRASKLFLDDFRAGRLGFVTLEVC
jgi:ribosome biogenesis GTPase A